MTQLPAVELDCFDDAIVSKILKEHTSYLADRYSERKENHQELSARVNQAKI